MSSPTLRQQPETSGSVPSASTTEPSSASNIPGLPQTDIAKAKKKEERRRRKGQRKKEKQKAREAVLAAQAVIQAGGMPGLANSDSSESEGSYSDNDSLYDATPAYNASNVSSAKTLSKFKIAPSQPKSNEQPVGKRGASSPADQDILHKRGSTIPRPGQSNKSK